MPLKEPNQAFSGSIKISMSSTDKIPVNDLVLAQVKQATGR
jgi:hypothetical protein